MPVDMQSEDVQRFDRWAETYDRSWMQRFLFDRVHRAVVRMAANLGEPSVVLDVGCGTGRLLREVRKRWPSAQVIGIDPAPRMVEVASRLAPDITFRVGSGEDLPLPDASVDLVLSTTSFHHWHDQAAGVREVSRVLRPGGHFILADVAAPTWMMRAFRHAHARSAREVGALFAEAGLTVIDQQPVFTRRVMATVGKREG